MIGYWSFFTVTTFAPLFEVNIQLAAVVEGVLLFWWVIIGYPWTRRLYRRFMSTAAWAGSPVPVPGRRSPHVQEGWVKQLEWTPSIPRAGGRNQTRFMSMLQRSRLKHNETTRSPSHTSKA